MSVDIRILHDMLSRERIGFEQLKSDVELSVEAQRACVKIEQDNLLRLAEESNRRLHTNAARIELLEELLEIEALPSEDESSE